jgi:hypothetical protein
MFTCKRIIITNKIHHHLGRITEHCGRWGIQTYKYLGGQIALPAQPSCGIPSRQRGFAFMDGLLSDKGVGLPIGCSSAGSLTMAPARPVMRRRKPMTTSFCNARMPWPSGLVRSITLVGNYLCLTRIVTARLVAWHCYRCPSMHEQGVQLLGAASHPLHLVGEECVCVQCSRCDGLGCWKRHREDRRGQGRG